jgi:hypothetical protein
MVRVLPPIRLWAGTFSTAYALPAHQPHAAPRKGTPARGDHAGARDGRPWMGDRIRPPYCLERRGAAGGSQIS